MVVILSQGCGKTSLAETLKFCFSNEAVSCVSMSLDDFYLTGLEQETVARRSGNPLLKLRGNGINTSLGPC